MKLSRKGPIEHGVKNHIRLGNRVGNYRRGKGKRPFIRSRPKKLVSGPSVLPHGDAGDYRVRLYYERYNNENFKLQAPSFQEAQKNGFSMSDNVIEPIKVSIRSI